MDSLRLLRPSHWIKNVIVFVPLFFGGALHDAVKIRAAIVAYAAFCLVASGGYALNDMLDAGSDGHDPEKKARPIPAGRISRARAGRIAVAAIGAGIAVAAIGAPGAAPVMGLYAILSVSYSVWVKRIPVLEMAFFPAFYLARIFAGGMATGIAISNWLVLCTIFMSLFLIAIKRSAEKGARAYPQALLDRLVAIFGASALMSYGLYCILGARSPYAVYSILFPIAGIMRYLALAEKDGGGEYPERVAIGDPFMASIVAVWILWMYALIY